MKIIHRRINFREYILGGQDGLVNVLGLVLGVASATLDLRIIIIAGLVATAAESVSMAAVAYTSSKAAKDYYQSLIKDDKHKKILLKHKFLLHEFENPLRSAFVVGVSTIVGSLIPLFPFFIFDIVKNGIIVSLIFSGLALFLIGSLKAKLSIGNWKKSGIEMLLIGMISALIGYGVGLLLKNMVFF